MHRSSGSVSLDCSCDSSQESTLVRILQAGGMFLIMLLAYTAFPSFGTQSSASGALGLSAIFLIGVTASASSCLAMVGGLLLSVSAKWSEGKQARSTWQRLQPATYFHVGRIAGYFLFGGLTGLLGRSLLLSVKTTGMVKVGIAIAMIILGLSILKLIPKNYCRIPLPQKLWKRIQALHTSESMFAPLILGAVTYFVPCGFTQSMQLLALSSGNFWTGALIMMIFALGTLPALLGISLVSTITNSKIHRLFLTFAGTLSVFLGIINVQSGLALSGVDLATFTPAFWKTNIALGNDPSVSIDQNGQQIIQIEVFDEGYNKDSFTIDAGKPTWIYANAPKDLSGCISSMAIPDFNILQPIRKGPNWIGPIQPEKDFSFMCSMGMFRANVQVRS